MHCERFSHSGRRKGERMTVHVVKARGPHPSNATHGRVFSPEHCRRVAVIESWRSSVPTPAFSFPTEKHICHKWAWVFPNDNQLKIRIKTKQFQMYVAEKNRGRQKSQNQVKQCKEPAEGKHSGKTASTQEELWGETNRIKHRQVSGKRRQRQIKLPKNLETNGIDCRISSQRTIWNANFIFHNKSINTQHNNHLQPLSIWISNSAFVLSAQVNKSEQARNYRTGRDLEGR